MSATTAQQAPGCFTGKLGGKSKVFPNALLPHQMHGAQWYGDMGPRERRKLQIFQNLLYMRLVEHQGVFCLIFVSN